MKGFQIQQKGERRISAALRIMLVVVLLAVQIGFVVAISYFMQEYPISSSGSSCFCWPRRWV